MRFADPEYLLLIILLAGVLFFFQKRKKKNEPAIHFSDVAIFNGINPSPRAKLKLLPRFFRCVALLLLIIAFARPQGTRIMEEVYDQGIDIMIVLDTSTSMRALDFDPEDRIQMAKKLAKEFIKGRTFDRIGVVIYAGLAYTQCPLTADRDAVIGYIDQVESGMTEIDGTAIGSAIAVAANRLKEGKGKSKVMILLTDGRNNMGEIDPVTAAQAAGAVNIKIYAIGTAKKGESVYPVEDPLFGKRFIRIAEQDLDEETLIKIAEATEGQYFRAEDRNAFVEIFKKIDAMEKTEIETHKYTKYNELFVYFLWPALFLLFFEALVSSLWLRKLP